MTVDGADAQDFDDAVYVETSAQGWILWVAIADVSHYVKPGGLLDEQAQARGTSVYFPGQVIPMLPERLSNDLCSLRPNVPRLTLVCRMHINAQGDVTERQFMRAVIRSHQRMTYDELTQMQQGERAVPEFWQPVYAAWQGLYAVVM